ncbi:uncharacterized protein LOC123559808 [Mercenaria mercenaria]|uniref:uncharacterized protein LOC123559808 n=1 Tax=Mercenaria mercenaria TaxID=6596 RepID=UPI001E1D5F7F|nr:uncharacterized protein LOC123559808 [Mercenaria mercenaria]XP_045207867.1 uncharacterized protein LOC123559808 [Mercenaria mercenaria]
MWILVFLVLYLSSGFAKITEIPLPTDVHLCFEQELSQSNVTNVIGEVIFSRCVHKVLWVKQTPQLKKRPLGTDAENWITSLVERSHIMDFPSGNSHPDAYRPRPRRQASRAQTGSRLQLERGQTGRRRQTLRRQPRVRKEYRMLTERERFMFHRAINMLKADTSVAPNKYDALAQLHYMSVGRAHYGPNFLPWHRLFLVVMENALREKIPSVTIPYWDSTLDDPLRDPRSSILWTPEFLGRANGYVIDGPFANWDTPTGQLVRYFGSGGTMMNWTYIYNAFRQSHLENISDPYARPENNIEDHHNQVHAWVGGHMAPPALAAFDPVFYLLHSYIDLLWEIFRGLQERRGIDPTTDYPRNVTEIPDGQRYDDPSGFGTLLNRHGLSNVFTKNIYKYDRPPSCTVQNQDCGTTNLRCDTSGSRPKCVSASVFDIRTLLLPNGLPMEGGSGIRELRSPGSKERKKQAKLFEMIESVSNVQCQAKNVNEKYVNNFGIDGVMDKQKWAYIPVQVVYKNHILSRQAPDSDAVYDICKRNTTSSNLPSRIFVESNGLNYNGMYKEISHFKNDLMTASLITYIGVKKPTTDAFTDVLVSGYDECGRICQPYCLDETRTRHRRCNGGIRISNDVPLLYGSDVKSAENSVWQEDQYGLPYIVENEIFMNILCETTKSFWPW